MELIKREARIDEEEQDVSMGSPTAYDPHAEYPGVGHLEHERFGSSSPEPLEVPPRHSTTTRDGIRIPGIRAVSTHELEYSGDELAHYSDFSDTPSQSYTHPSSLGSFMQRDQRKVSNSNTPYAPQNRLEAIRNGSQVSGFHVESDERVIWHGHLFCLKSKGGVRQWKRLWVVLRPKNLAFYKNDEVLCHQVHVVFWHSSPLQEYAANLILPLSNIINAVEIDPISRSKRHCMQIIAEEKSYRFCALSEDGLAEWLGALKSQLAKRKEISARKQLPAPTPVT